MALLRGLFKKRLFPIGGRHQSLEDILPREIVLLSESFGFLTTKYIFLPC